MVPCRAFLAETGQPVRSTDLYDRGYGTSGVDFLTTQSEADNIITNPPYNCAEGFVASGLKQMKYKLALLLRLALATPEQPLMTYPEALCEWVRVTAHGQLLLLMKGRFVVACSPGSLIRLLRQISNLEKANTKVGRCVRRLQAHGLIT